MNGFEQLEKSVGWTFRDRTLLSRALTHSSFINEHPELQKEDCNERLEYFGDAILEFLVSEYLYTNYPSLMEGELSKMRVALVCEMSLADAAGKLRLGSFLRMGKGMEKSGGRSSDSIVSDAFEALLAALYLDGGIENCRKLVESCLLSDSDERRVFYDAKTILQEMAQEKGKSVSYREFPPEGPEHDRLFRSEALIGEEVFAEGSGHSKKKAEQNAAYTAITVIREHKKCI